MKSMAMEQAVKQLGHNLIERLEREPKGFAAGAGKLILVRPDLAPALFSIARNRKRQRANGRQEVNHG